jgi:predicted esterase
MDDVFAPGEQDFMIRCDWGRKTAANLLLQGADVQFRTYKGVAHDMDPREVCATWWADCFIL